MTKKVDILSTIRRDKISTGFGTGPADPDLDIFYSEFLIKYMDRSKMIWSGDTGDSAHRTGSFWYMYARMHPTVTESCYFSSAMRSMESEKYLYLRHPNLKVDASLVGWGEIKSWINKVLRINILKIPQGQIPFMVSRDNLIPLILACGTTYRDLRPHLIRMVKYFCKRFGMLPNITDFLMPQHWAALFRALRWWWMRPVLWIGDFCLLIEAAIQVYFKDKNDTSDKLNTSMLIDFSNYKYRTWISMLCMLIYKKLDVKYVYDYYYEIYPRQASLASLPLNKVAAPWIGEAFG